jgi:hypothetical protein
MNDLVHQACFLTKYDSLIYPYLMYCNIVWASIYASYLHKLLILQNTFARQSTSSNYLVPFATLLKKLNVLSIYDINVCHLHTFIYKNSYLPSSLPKLFNGFFQVNSEIHLYNTRHCDNIYIYI